MKLVLNFVIINHEIHKTVCPVFNFIVTIVANEVVFCDFKNFLRLFPTLVEIEFCFSETWP